MNPPCACCSGSYDPLGGRESGSPSTFGLMLAFEEKYQLSQFSPKDRLVEIGGRGGRWKSCLLLVHSHIRGTENLFSREFLISFRDNKVLCLLLGGFESAIQHPKNPPRMKTREKYMNPSSRAATFLNLYMTGKCLAEYIWIDSSLRTAVSSASNLPSKDRLVEILVRRERRKLSIRLLGSTGSPNWWLSLFCRNFQGIVSKQCCILHCCSPPSIISLSKINTAEIRKGYQEPPIRSLIQLLRQMQLLLTCDYTYISYLIGEWGVLCRLYFDLEESKSLNIILRGMVDVLLAGVAISEDHGGLDASEAIAI